MEMSIRFRLLSGSVGIVVLILCLSCAKSKVSQQTESIWGKKPVLSYLLSKKASIRQLGKDLGLTELQLQRINDIVESEQDSLRLLYAESEQFVKNAKLSPEEKKAKIKALNYDSRITKILQMSKVEIENLLTAEQYDQFVKLIEEKWAAEVKKHNSLAK